MRTLPVYLMAFLAVLLSGCRSTLITDLVARPGEKLFWDDFSDPSGNWPQFAGPNGNAGVAQGGLPDTGCFGAKGDIGHQRAYLPGCAGGGGCHAPGRPVAKPVRAGLPIQRCE
jgi:hypothetical protein